MTPLETALTIFGIMALLCTPLVIVLRPRRYKRIRPPYYVHGRRRGE